MSDMRDTVTDDEVTVNKNQEASSSQSESDESTGSPQTHGEASPSTNVESSENLAIQGIQNLNLVDEVKNELGETSIPNTDAEIETILPANHLVELSTEALHPPVPEINVTLGPNHHTYTLGFVHSIDGKEVTVKGVGSHAPLDEKSILWITENREPLGFVDRIVETKTPNYVIRYNNEDEIPSGVGIGTHVSFVPGFAYMRNDDIPNESGHNALGETDEELPEEAKISEHEKEVNHTQTLNISESPNLQQSQVHESHCSQTYQYFERGQDVISSPGSGVWSNAMTVRPLMSHSNVIPTNGIPQSIVPAGGYQVTVVVTQHNGESGGDWVWPNAMAIQQQQQMVAPAFPTNRSTFMQQPNTLVHAGRRGTGVFLPTSLPNSRISLQHEQQAISNIFYTDETWMTQQNNLVQNPYNMLMPTYQTMPITQQFVPSQMLPYMTLELGNQASQQHMFFSDTYPTNGMRVILQNSFVERPQYMISPMPRMPLYQQPRPEPTLPDFYLPGLQHDLVGSSTADRPFPRVFGQLNGNQSSVPPAPSVFLTHVPPTIGHSTAAQLPLSVPPNTNRGHQVHPSVPPNTRWRGCSGEKEGHFGRDAGPST